MFVSVRDCVCLYVCVSGGHTACWRHGRGSLKDAINLVIFSTKIVLPLCASRACVAQGGVFKGMKGAGEDV